MEYVCLPASVDGTCWFMNRLCVYLFIYELFVCWFKMLFTNRLFVHVMCLFICKRTRTLYFVYIIVFIYMFV